MTIAFSTKTKFGASALYSYPLALSSQDQNNYLQTIPYTYIYSDMNLKNQPEQIIVPPRLYPLIKIIFFRDSESIQVVCNKPHRP